MNNCCGAEGRPALGKTEVMCWGVWVEGDVINQGVHWRFQKEKER